MSNTVDYQDLWLDLYEYVLAKKITSVIDIMEEMDPRLTEEDLSDTISFTNDEKDVGC